MSTMTIEERTRLADLVAKTITGYNEVLETTLEHRHGRFVGVRELFMTPEVRALPEGAIEQFIISLNQWHWDQNFQYHDQDLTLDPLKEVLDRIKGARSDYNGGVQPMQNEFTRLDAAQTAGIEFVTDCYRAMNELRDPQSTALEYGKMWEMMSFIDDEGRTQSAVKVKFFVGSDHVLDVKPDHECVILDSRENAVVFIGRIMKAFTHNEDGFPTKEFYRLALLAYPDLEHVRVNPPNM